jgi:hypothetical protein
MTEQEAKALSEWFKVRKGKTLKLNDNGIDCIIEALEKQIAKKPTEQYGEEEPAYLCPICEHWVYVGEPYCDGCGQKLDWSEV